MVISPYERPGYVDHTTYEFSSVLRFIEELHGLQPLTDRDAQASPLAGAFDFSQAPRLDVPKLRERTCPTS
jgi:phospholipase C